MFMCIFFSWFIIFVTRWSGTISRFFIFEHAKDSTGRWFTRRYSLGTISADEITDDDMVNCRQWSCGLQEEESNKKVNTVSNINRKTAPTKNGHFFPSQIRFYSHHSKSIAQTQFCCHSIIPSTVVYNCRNLIWFCSTRGLFNLSINKHRVSHDNHVWYYNYNQRIICEIRD